LPNVGGYGGRVEERDIIGLDKVICP